MVRAPGCANTAGAFFSAPQRHRTPMGDQAPAQRERKGKLCLGKKFAKQPRRGAEGEFLATLAWTAAGATLPPYALCVFDSGQSGNVVVRAGVE